MHNGHADLAVSAAVIFIVDLFSKDFVIQRVVQGQGKDLVECG